MARDNFTILLNLEDYFSDDRQRARIYIDRKYSKISDLEDRISEIFGIKRFHLLSDVHFLPPSEDIALLKNGETVSVKPNISPSQTILLSEAFYNKNNTSDNNTLISGHGGPLKTKRTNTVFHCDKKVCVEATLLTDTPDTSNGPYTSTKSVHQNEETIETHSNKKKKRLEKKSNDDLNNKGLKLIKSKKRKHNELEEANCFLKESSQGRTELRNEEFLREESKHSKVNLVRNQKLMSDENSIEPNVIENEYCSQPIPYKKARNCKSWSNSPLPKTTNIVKIIKIPIDKIEIDNTRFVYTPDESLPPLEPIVVEMENMNNSTAEFNGDISMKSPNLSDKSKEMELQNSPNTPKHNSQLTQSQKFRDVSQQMKSNNCPEDSQQKQSQNSYDMLNEHMKSQNFPGKLVQMELLNCPDELQNNIESSKSQNSPEILEKMESQNIPDATQRINSEIHTDQPKHNIELKKSQNFSDKSATQMETLNISEISQQGKLQKYCIESQTIKSQNCSGESQLMKPLQSSDSSKQHINLQTCIDHVNKELMQSPNFPNALQQTKSHNSTEVSQQTETQNLLHLSQQIQAQNCSGSQISSDTAQNDLDFSTTQQLNSLGKSNNWSKLLVRISELSQSDMKKSRSKSRERWRQQIGIHSADSGRLFNLKIDSPKTLRNSSLCHNSLLDDKYASSETNGNNEGLLKINGSESPNAEHENAIEIDPISVGCAQYSLKPEQTHEEILRIEDCMKDGIKLSTEISRPNDNITEDSSVLHETITDIENFPEPKRKRKRRHRKKKKVESEIPKKFQETRNAFPSKWVPYIPAKPRIHLRFDSSEDDISLDKNELNIANVENDTSTPVEKIKILQDVTISPDTNSLIDQMENEVAIGSSSQNKLTDRCGNNVEHYNPVEFSNEAEDYFERLLQMKKEELLRTMDSITSAND